jgi:hypothetical protein
MPFSPSQVYQRPGHSSELLSLETRYTQRHQTGESPHRAEGESRWDDEERRGEKRRGKEMRGAERKVRAMIVKEKGLDDREEMRVE